MARIGDTLPFPKKRHEPTHAGHMATVIEIEDEPMTQHLTLECSCDGSIVSFTSQKIGL